LLLTCFGGAATAAAVFAGRRFGSWRARLLLAGLLGSGVAIPLLALYAGCLLNPLGDLPDIVRRDWLAQVAEALSLPRALLYSPEMVLGGIVPLAIGAVLALRRARGAAIPEAAYRDAVLAGFLAAGVAVAAVQLRGIYAASAALPLVAGPALDRALRMLAARQDRARAFASLALALGTLGKVAALPVLAVQAVSGWKAPAGITRQISDCADQRSVARLRALGPATVLAPIDLGPALLLHTPHAIVAAPYHRAAAGIAATLTAFSGSEADLRREAEAAPAGLVALCRAWTEGEPDSFAHALAAGRRVPWLEPVVAGSGDLMAWRVVRSDARR
ncbi:MAG: hypothetical protein JWQ36_865, partial [Enterovirga sp.]|nr:hypothetical protein [Enterovirga sp.]